MKTNTDMAWDLIEDLYGEMKHKDGMSIIEIKRLWDKQIGDYHWSDIQRSIEEGFQYDKRKAPPTLAHVSMRLRKVEKVKKFINPAVRDIPIGLRTGRFNYLKFKEDNFPDVERDGKLYTWVKINSILMHHVRKFCMDNKEEFETYETNNSWDKIYFYFLDKKRVRKYSRNCI